MWRRHVILLEDEGPRVLVNTLRTRGVNFAFLFGPPRFIGREEATRLHGRVCDALSIDDFTFRYSSSDSNIKGTSRGFSILLERQEGRGRFCVRVEHPGAGNPIRVLMEYHWPPSDVHVAERFDMVSKAVFESLDGTWQRVMAEARLRKQCDVGQENALSYMSQDLLQLSATQQNALGSPFTFATIGLHTSPAGPTDDPLANPAQQLTIEVLREEPRSLYLELMSQWTQVPVGGDSIELSTIRPIDRLPSEYVEAAQNALTAWVSTRGKAS